MLVGRQKYVKIKNTGTLVQISCRLISNLICHSCEVGGIILATEKCSLTQI